MQADSVIHYDFGESGRGRYPSNHFWEPSVEHGIHHHAWSIYIGYIIMYWLHPLKDPRLLACEVRQVKRSTMATCKITLLLLLQCDGWSVMLSPSLSL